MFEDRVTIDIVKLKKDHGIEIDNIEYSSVINTGQDKTPRSMRSYFAELILETGKYSFEDKVKIDVSSYQKFVGYKVTIKPSKRKDEYRTYFVLVSKDIKFI